VNRLKLIKHRLLIPGLVIISRLILGSRSKSQNNSNFLFIIGSGRNGSTLLSSILNNNPKIFIPPEQYIIPFFAAKWQLDRFSSHDRFYTKLISSLLIKKKTVNWILTEEDYQKIAVSITHESYSKIIESIFRKYASKTGKESVEVFGEKSPMSTHYLQLLSGEFSQSKYLFLIRDPRDVIYSFSKVPNHMANDIEFAIWKWKDAVSQYKWILKRSEKVMLVKYEDLVANPKMVMENIHQFLGLTYYKEVLESQYDSKFMGVSELVHHQNLAKPINKDSVGKWRDELIQEDLMIIQRKLSKIAREFGYDLFD